MGEVETDAPQARHPDATAVRVKHASATMTLSAAIIRGMKCVSNIAPTIAEAALEKAEQKQVEEEAGTAVNLNREQAVTGVNARTASVLLIRSVATPCGTKPVPLNVPRIVMAVEPLLRKAVVAQLAAPTAALQAMGPVAGDALVKPAFANRIRTAVIRNGTTFV